MGNAAKQLTQSTPTTYTHSFKEFTSSISVLSYNILADCYVDPLYFPYAKKNSLAFAQRAQKIIQLLHQLNADIILLQECDHYNDCYRLAFEASGNYDHMFVQRPTREDGLLVAWNQNKFEFKSHTVLQFDDIAKENKYDLNYQRQQVGVTCELVHRESKQVIVVATTHLFWDPKMEFVKYHQILNFVTYLNKYYANTNIPIIFAGDYNSLPHSNQIQYLLAKQEPEQSRIEVYAKTQCEIMKKEYERHKVHNQIKWHNAYENYLGDGAYPPFTNYTERWQGTIDHIFYRAGCGLLLKKVLHLPPKDLMIREVALPNEEFPSDHLPLMAEFDIIN